MREEQNYGQRSNWLRAAVLGANDGILSTASIIIGVATASNTREPVILASVAGLVAGALSMAAGEYVSVSSQTDIEKADLAREKQELKNFPDDELQELANIYEKRGLPKDLALEVAKKLSEKNVLEAHARDELGINKITEPHPLQAALSSGASFTFGAIFPVMVAFFGKLSIMEYLQYGFAIIFLMILGGISAKVGGSNIKKGILRVTFWGTVAMALTAAVGYFFGTRVG